MTGSLGITLRTWSATEATIPQQRDRCIIPMRSSSECLIFCPLLTRMMKDPTPRLESQRASAGESEMYSPLASHTVGEGEPGEG